MGARVKPLDHLLSIIELIRLQLLLPLRLFTKEVDIIQGQRLQHFFLRLAELSRLLRDRIM